MGHSQIKKIKYGIASTFAVFLLVSVLNHLGLFQRYEWIIYDGFLSQIRDQTPAPKDIAIILIDDASLQAMDPVVGRFPWPRSIYADLLEYLSMGSPKAILFDLLFVERQTSIETPSLQAEENDTRLIEATSLSGITYHAAQFIDDIEDEVNRGLTQRSLPIGFVEHFSAGLVSKPDSEPQARGRHQSNIDGALGSTDERLQESLFNNYLIPIDGLYQAAKGIGIVSVDPDRDGILRRTRLFHDYQNQSYPALSIVSLLNNRNTLLLKTQGQISFNHTPLPLASDGSIYINMYKRFDSYSISGVLASIAMLHEGEVENLIVDPSEFKDKYVFIGASAVGLADLKNTAVGQRIPGVTIHASVLGNILQNDLLQPPSNTFTTLSILVLTMLTSLVVLSVSRISLQIIYPITIGLFFVAWCYWQYAANQIVLVVAPLFALFLSWGLAYIFIVFTEEKEKKKIRKMFSQYVSPAALTVMVDQYDDYSCMGAGSKETVSILFADIRGFTSLSESLDAQKIVELLNHYFTVMTKAILSNGGTIDKFIGDAIMAIWGAPIKDHNHAKHSVESALEMIRCLDDVNSWLAGKGFDPINIGIGINTGEVILGSIGSEQKADYTVIGDNVNLASRLEGVTKVYGCQIILSETTYHAVKSTIPCRVVDLVRVKGKNKPIKIYAPIVMEALPGSLSIQDAIAIEFQIKQAFNAYLKQQWDMALELFDALPQDTLTELYKQRCCNYKSAPPPKDWDGTLSMKTK